MKSGYALSMQDLATLSALTFGAQAFVTLFVILDPPGAAPIFLGLAAGKTVKEQRKLAWQAAFVSLFVIVTFALFGNALLDYLNISLAALQGAGGILLLITGLGLLTGSLVEIVTTMLYVQKADNGGQLTSLALAIIAVHIIIGITFMFSTKILAVIKDSGVTLLARIAGLLLSAIAVEMIVSSIKSFFSIS